MTGKIPPLRNLSTEDLHEFLTRCFDEAIRRTAEPDGENPAQVSQILYSEKMVSVGLLTRGLAHEFNNLFTRIITYCDYALAKGSPQDLEKASQIALISAQKGSVMIRNLQCFAQLTKSHREPVHLEKILQRTVALLRVHLDRHQVNLHSTLAPTPPVLADPTDLQQALVNLLNNSLDAIKDGGQIWVNTSTSDGMVVVEVGDDGRGISEDALPHIFKPFFFSAPQHRGEVPSRGIGLAVTRLIVEKYGGTIDVESKVDGGTAFTLRFPVNPQEAN